MNQTTVPKLTDPLEVVGVGHILFHHPGDHISGMHLYDNKCRQRHSLDLLQVQPDQVSQVVQLTQQFLVTLFQTLVLQGLRNFWCPVRLTASDHNLTGPLQHPIRSLNLSNICNT